MPPKFADHHGPIFGLNYFYTINQAVSLALRRELQSQAQKDVACSHSFVKYNEIHRMRIQCFGLIFRGQLLSQRIWRRKQTRKNTIEPNGRDCPERLNSLGDWQAGDWHWSWISPLKLAIFNCFRSRVKNLCIKRLKIFDALCLKDYFEKKGKANIFHAKEKGGRRVAWTAWR